MECLINSYSTMSELPSPQEEDCANKEQPFHISDEYRKKGKSKTAPAVLLEQVSFLMMYPRPCCIHFLLCSALRTGVLSMIICLHFNSNLDLYKSRQIAFAIFFYLLLFYAHYCTFPCAMYGDEIPCATYCVRCFNK